MIITLSSAATTARKPAFPIHRIGIYAFLLISALFFLVPIYLMVATSLKGMPEIRAGNGLSWPIAPSFGAWVAAWSTACTGSVCEGISAGFWNSVKITIPAVILSCSVGAITGYTLSFWRFPGMNLIFGILVVAIFIPYQVFIFPMVSIFASLGLYGNMVGVIFIHVIFGMPITTLMFRNYYASLPLELIKAARVDGAGYFRIFFQIILPLSPPIIVVAVIWQATGVWNDYLFGLVFAGMENQPMTVQLNNILQSQMGAREYNMEMAATLLTALVPLSIYLLSGKWFVRGIVGGAIKG
ncbi:carbohydrate ABC transporter permease [Rhizobium sp. CF142]|uniref:carbohydrate ABC transporter permease n=1 Tax=Rhizobium sp. CF142 TaxID=1144314 RepID=UPI00026EF6A0|nr:carbohydrate ABC transporter permease [Rhizobium sp. CF142]EJJ27118.1 ABC-type sugar transport system, permease component [Rhizobium sp. CF142]